VEGIRHNNVEGVASGAIVPDKYLIPFLQGDLVPADHVIGDAGGQVDGVKEEGGIGAIYDFCRYAEIRPGFVAQQEGGYKDKVFLPIVPGADVGRNGDKAAGFGSLGVGRGSEYVGTGIGWGAVVLYLYCFQQDGPDVLWWGMGVVKLLRDIKIMDILGHGVVKACYYYLAFNDPGCVFIYRAGGLNLVN
jgi:hypothetical protein